MDPLWEQILGYLNFSAGKPDPVFQRNLDRLWRGLAPENEPAWQRLGRECHEQLDRLAITSPALSDATQARGALKAIFEHLIPLYRQHHGDLLFHQDDETLFNSFFVARCAEAVLTQGGPWEEPAVVAQAALVSLNDYIGHRPLAVLHNSRQCEPYDHERIRPIPVALQSAGTAVGRYEPLIEKTLEILTATEPGLLDQADFELELLEELAIDPRAYDFGHPAGRRPNYQFGEWDPHRIDNAGRYRRFVIRQVTLDALLDRVIHTPNLPQNELIFEASAVLAGVILMAAGTSGRGPGMHDSNVTLNSLVPKIAKYRDRFYVDLIETLHGPHGDRLRREADTTRQPFGGARQHLNRYLARLRAAQLQHLELARLFAEMGYPEASQRQAAVVPVARGRMLAEIAARITLAHQDLDSGQGDVAFERLIEAEDLIDRAIRCGAFVDPWNILGFGGQYPFFGGPEHSVQDPRVEELVDLVDGMLTLSVRIVSESAATGGQALVSKTIERLERFAGWWDRFASTTVSGVSSIRGSDAADSAKHLAEVLGQWFAKGATVDDVLFWREQIDRFTAPKGYALVIEALLNKQDDSSAMALLMQWLSQSDTVPLEEEAFSFYLLCLRWMQRSGPSRLFRATSDAEGPRAPIAGQMPEQQPLPWPLVRKFFDFLEANAEELWEVPQMASAVAKAQQAAEGEQTEEDEDDSDNPFAAAYEDMSYRDSTADGVEGSTAETGPAPMDSDELTAEAKSISRRLRFLTILAELWRIAVGRHLDHREFRPSRPDPARPDAWTGDVLGWLSRARQNSQDLIRLLGQVTDLQSAGLMTGEEAILEDDRKRRIQQELAQEVLGAAVAHERSIAAMLAVLPPPVARSSNELRSLPRWQQLASDLDRAALSGFVDEIPPLIEPLFAELAQQPLLYVPLNKGGDPSKLVAAMRLHQVLRFLLKLLPRLGLFEQTYQLLQTARRMERDWPVGPRAVTEFDRLFQVGFQGVVEQTARSSTEDDTFEGDERLVAFVQNIVEVFGPLWRAHSRSVRLNVLERVESPGDWQRLVTLIKNYGRDLFVPQFLRLSSLRGLIHRGVEAYFDQLTETEDPAQWPRLLHDLGSRLPREQTLADLDLILEAVAENYEHYKDYHSTTTQSDSGQNLFMLLDFLRVKVGYERHAWTLKPQVLAHEVLVRQGRPGAAELWRRTVADRTSATADSFLRQLTERELEHGMQLPTVGDTIRERFMRPFHLDRIRALVRPAVEEARAGRPLRTLPILEQELEDYTRTPTGSGLDMPTWLLTLGHEVREARREVNPALHALEWSPELPRTLLDSEELVERLAELLAAGGTAT
jgi:hypothetical protein